MADYTLNNYRTRKLDGRYILTTDHGSMCVLDVEEHRQLQSHNIDSKLRHKLEEREIVLTEENLPEVMRLMRNRNIGLFSGASLHILIPTLRCRMNCIYCHASSKVANARGCDMDISTADRILDFIFQSPSNRLSVEFQGGEPLLNWKVLKHVAQRALERNAREKRELTMTVVTSLTDMDDTKMKFLVENDISVCTSLDGPQELHDHNRKLAGKSNHAQVCRWLIRLQDAYKRKGGKAGVNALVTLTRESLSYPTEIVDEYVRLGLRSIHLRYLNMLGTAQRSWKSISYSPEEYLDFWKKAMRRIQEHQEKGVKIGERMVNIMHLKMIQERDPNYLDLRSPCGAAIGQLAYDHNGDVFTCDEARMIGEDTFRIGNVHRNSYRDVVCCDKACAVLESSVNDQYVCDSCAYKPYCGLCPVCNYVEQGSVVGKVSETARCKVLMEQFDWVVREKFLNNRIRE
jgi:His-Xaa-Ser system radical SAM maturase HxsB